MDLPPEMIASSAAAESGNVPLSRFRAHRASADRILRRDANVSQKNGSRTGMARSEFEHEEALGTVSTRSQGSTSLTATVICSLLRGAHRRQKEYDLPKPRGQTAKGNTTQKNWHRELSTRELPLELRGDSIPLRCGAVPTHLKICFLLHQAPIRLSRILSPLIVLSILIAIHS